MRVEIGTITELLNIDSRIPEFSINKTKQAEIEKRLSNTKYLILIAKINDEAVGYKVGYELSSGSFYSWLGGVLPQFRKLGIATKLREYQESWAKSSGYKK